MRDGELCALKWGDMEYGKRQYIHIQREMPHDIRRTVLTNLYMMGMPVKKIQVFAGHSSVQQTMDYIRISDDNDDVINYLNRLSEMRTETNIITFRKKA
ncbi:MAG: site-specific integrase [Lachnospiraceae bacterium]|nr:site-specific integrase [Lachnospiraceae bacterium]